MRDVVKFNGKPEIVTLEYPTGKEGVRIFEGQARTFFTYSLADNKIMFATESLNEKLQTMSPPLRAGESLSIQIMANNHWKIERLDPPAGRTGEALTGAPASSQAGQTQHRNGNTAALTQLGNVLVHGDPAGPQLPARRPDTYLLQFYVDAVDLVIAIEKYAASCGRDLRFTSEDVRCIAATSRIDAQKGGR